MLQCHSHHHQRYRTHCHITITVSISIAIVITVDLVTIPIIVLKIVTGNATYVRFWPLRRNCVFYQSWRNVLAPEEGEEEGGRRVEGVVNVRDLMFVLPFDCFEREMN